MRSRLLVATIAVAGSSIANATPLPSLVDAGTLERGQFGIRSGLGLGPGMFGFGVQAGVGLRRVDVLASANFLPALCLNVGFGTACDPTVGTLGFGAQVALVDRSAFHLDARIHGEASYMGDRIGLATATILATTGTRHVRFSLGPALVAFAEQDDPFGQNGWYAGGVARLAVVTENGRGLELVGGAAGQLRMVDPNVLPLFGISYVASL